MDNGRRVCSLVVDPFDFPERDVDRLRWILERQLELLAQDLTVDPRLILCDIRDTIVAIRSIKRVGITRQEKEEEVAVQESGVTVTTNQDNQLSILRQKRESEGKKSAK